MVRLFNLSAGSGQAFDDEVLIVDLAAWVVGLEGEGAGAELAAGHALRRSPVFRLGEVHGLLAVDPDLNALTFDAHVVFKPDIVRCGWDIQDVANSIEAARALDVAMASVDLAFEASGGPAAILVGRVEVDAGIGFRVGLHLRFEVEVLELCFAVGTDVVDVTLAAANLQDAVFHLVGAFGGVLGGLPASEGLAVEELDCFAGERGVRAQEERGRGQQGGAEG